MQIGSTSNEMNEYLHEWCTWHSSDGTIRVSESSAIHGIVGSNHQSEVHIREIAINLIHLVNDIVRDPSLGQQNIQLSRHAASDWMDTKSDFLASLLQHLR